MRFERPEMLWLLLVTLPLLAGFLWWSWQKRKWLIAQFVQARLLPNLMSGFSTLRQGCRMGLQLVAVVMILLAMARPQWGLSWQEAKQHGLDILIAIDASRSMLAQDVSPNRLARAKLAAEDLVRLAKNDRVGLIAFAGTAFLQCPLTIDEDAFRQSLDALEVGIMPQGGTAIAAAVATAIETFRQEGSPYKVLVVFTDGEDHEEGALEQAKKAAGLGIRIFTVGVGTASGDLLRQPRPNGGWDYIKDPDGNVVKSRLNETLLAQIAGDAQGFYLPLAGGKTMDVLFAKGLAPLPRGDIAARYFRQFRERYQWPLGLALLCLIVEMFLLDRKALRRRGPVPAPSAAWVRGAALLACLTFSAAAHGSARTAWGEFQAGHFSSAQSEYERLLEKKPNDSRLEYNAGVAAYDAGHYADAARHFHSSSQAADLALQEKSYYNFGNALFRAGEKEHDPGKSIPFWEESLRQFNSALALDPTDRDSKFNRELVRKKLEELKKKNPPPPQQQRNKSQQNQKKKPQNKPDKNEEKKSENAQQQNEGDQPSKPPPASKPDEQRAKKNREQPKPEKGSSKGEQNGSADSAASQVRPGQMTPDQARQLLDAMKDQERALFMPPPTGAVKRVWKDW